MVSCFYLHVATLIVFYLGYLEASQPRLVARRNAVVVEKEPTATELSH